MSFVFFAWNEKEKDVHFEPISYELFVATSTNSLCY